jgi:hypothetical protein
VPTTKCLPPLLSFRRPAERAGQGRSLKAKKPCRCPDHRRVKIHRNYVIEEVASLLNVHASTVRVWIRNGLPLIDHRRPYLISGLDLVTFLKRRRAQNRRPCGPGQIYCLRCRTPQRPAGDMADYVARTDRTGALIGLCPRCGMVMYRCMSRARFPEVCAGLEVRIMQEHLRLSDSTCPFVNDHFGQE